MFTFIAKMFTIDLLPPKNYFRLLDIITYVSGVRMRAHPFLLFVIAVLLSFTQVSAGLREDGFARGVLDAVGGIASSDLCLPFIALEGVRKGS